MFTYFPLLYRRRKHILRQRIVSRKFVGGHLGDQCLQGVVKGGKNEQAEGVECFCVFFN